MSSKQPHFESLTGTAVSLQFKGTLLKMLEIDAYMCFINGNLVNAPREENHSHLRS